MFTVRETSASLKRKGFIEDKGKRHVFYYYHYEGEKISSIRTMISHGAKEVDAYLIRQMARQTQLSKNQFVKLIDCSLKKEKYLKHLLDSGLIPKEFKN
jgi:hypothetical protein